jgi:N-acetylneuraminic acid mutarotase
MKNTFSLLLLLTFFSIKAFSQNWVQKASMPTAGRYAGIAFVVNNKAYVGLGVNASQQKYHDIWEYTPGTNSWIQKVNYPGNGMYASTAFSINGKGYVCLGGDATSNTNGTNQLWEYEPTTDTWTQKANFPGTARYGASCFVIGDTAFLGTGSNNVPTNYLFDFWMYVPATNTWTQLANYPGGHRNHGNAFSIQNYGFLGTGLVTNSVVTNDFWRYNKQTNTWTNITPMLGTDRMGTASFTYLNKGYVGTGKTIGGVYYNTFYEYSPGANTWNLMSTSGGLPGRSTAFTFELGGEVYIGTGQASPSPLSDLWSWKIDITGMNNEDVTGELEGVTVYPNPVEDVLHLESTNTNETYHFEISNELGQVLYEGNFTNKSTVHTDGFASGVYFIKLNNGKTTEFKKIIIQ